MLRLSFARQFNVENLMAGKSSVLRDHRTMWFIVDDESCV